MKSRVFSKVTLLLTGVTMMLNMATSKSQNAGRKVEKSFYDEMKVIDAAYASNIKLSNDGLYTDFNKAGVADNLKKSYEAKPVSLSKADLRIPTTDHEINVVKNGYPQRIAYLQQNMNNMKSSVDKYNAKRELLRMQKILEIVNNNK